MIRRAWPIIRREYMTRITTKGFWISTALLPLLTIAMALIPILTSRTGASDDPIRIVDALSDFYPLFEESAAGYLSGEDEGDLPPLSLVPATPETLADVRRDLNELAENGEIHGYFVIDEETIYAEEVIFYAASPSAAIGEQSVRSVLATSIRMYRLKNLGIVDDDIEQAVQGIYFEIRKATNDPDEQEVTGTASFLTSFALVLFIYFSLIFYGVHVLRGVLEEKTSRIVEIIVSTTRPFDLMMGKILGIGSVGLTQVLIWVVFGALISAPKVATTFSISKENLPDLDWATLIFFPVYFVLGFFLYATIYAGIASIFSSEEDAQQMTSLATMMLVIPLMVMTPVIKNPSGGLAVGLSLFPFFTPILMYLRIAVQMPPTWQIALSIGIMIATILVMIWLCAKIYRIGILMYGKKPTIPEIFRWLRYT